jgi:arginine exporter protein ArgO
MFRTRWPVALFVPWTLFVWANRVVNTMGDDSADKPLTFALALSVVVPVMVLGVVLVGARQRRLTEVETRLFRAASVWTILVWLVRGTEIALSADHGLDFKIVHLVIGAVSVGLALATVRVARDERASGVSPPVAVGR